VREGIFTIFLIASGTKGIPVPLNQGDVVLASVVVIHSGQYDFSYGGGVIGKTGGVLDVVLRVNTITIDEASFSGIAEVNNQTMQVVGAGIIQLARNDIVDIAVNHHGAMYDIAFTGEDTVSTKSKLQLRLHR
jgi:hypothetical protein